MEKIIHEKVKTNITRHPLLEHNVLIVWKLEYNLGIPIVDEQHRGIVSTINSLFFGMQNNHGKDMLAPIIGMIYEYTHIHCNIEEDFLEKYGFPNVQNHRKLHSELTDALAKIGKKSVLDRDPFEFMGFLKDWWIGHICDKDRIFRDYLYEDAKSFGKAKIK